MTTRKVLTAQALWRDYPGEIASDLSQFHGLRIADWHRGVMASYELIELCEFMDDGGRFKAALRHDVPGHPWLLKPWGEQAQAGFQTANETSLLRALKAPSFNSEDIGSTLFLSPQLLTEMAGVQAEAGEARGAVFAQIQRGHHDSDDDDSERQVS